MIYVGICDDDIEMVAKIERLVEDYMKWKHILTNIEIFNVGSDVIDYINKGERYDIIFLDIEMQGINGIDVAREIRKVDKNFILIYVSGHTQYAIEAYEVQPFRFLQKPFSLDKFYQYYDAAIQEIRQNDVCFRYSANKQNFRIMIKDIIYFESRNRIIIYF